MKLTKILSENSKIVPFWILTITAIIGLVVSQLIQDGVFLDGMLYTSVSLNLAEGRGTFWDTHFSKTVFDSFHEQPPLYFGLLALFYKVLGTSIYVERFFTLVFLGGTAFYIHKFWKLIFSKEKNIAKNSWLPIFFWITMPVCFWAYINSVEEVVMSFFALTSVYYIYAALRSKKQIFFKLFIAGVLVFLSSLTKGVQGLFPLVTIGFYWLVTREITLKKAIMSSLFLLAIVVAVYGFLLLTNDAVYDSYYKYFESRIVSTFNNVRVTDGRFYLIKRLIYELLPMTIVSAIIFYINRRKYNDKGDVKTKLIIWLFLIGLSGALPLMVTLEQRGFYLVTTLPFFSIGVAMWLAPNLSNIMDRLNPVNKGFKIFRAITIVLLIGSIVFTTLQIGKVKRYKDFLPDVYAFGAIIPRGEIINIVGDLNENWGLKTSMIRYNYISLYPGAKNYKYLLINKEESIDIIPAGYKKIPIETQVLDLYVNETILGSRDD